MKVETERGKNPEQKQEKLLKISQRNADVYKMVKS